MKKKVLSLIMVVFMLLPGFVFADANSAKEKVLGYYSNNTALSSWYDVVALWGAGESLEGYTFSIWNSDSLSENASVADYAGVILGLVAAGENVHDIWGRDIARELAEMQNKETGAFGDYINMQAFAILALDAAGEDYDKEGALAALASDEINGGGFGFNVETADVDLTAMALMALSGTEYTDVIERAVSFLADRQLESGGFESWGTENSNTLEVVISALSSLGKLEDERFIKNDKTLCDVLEEYVLEDGSMTFEKGDSECNLMATQQGLIAFGDIFFGESVYKRLKSKYECTPIKTVNCKVRIEGVNNNILNSELTVSSKNPTVLDAISVALDKNEIDYIISDSDFGPYIHSINGETAAMFGGWDGWLFLVNGIAATASADDTQLFENDEILLYYGLFEPETLIPKYFVSSDKIYTGDTFTITVTSSYMDYDSGKMIDVKIGNATIEIDGTKYITDDNGKTKITINKAGTYSVQIYKNNENSYPSIVRIAPFEIEVSKKQSGSSTGGTAKIQIKEEVTDNEPAAEKEEFELKFFDKDSISDWAVESVKRASMKNILKGDEKGLFNPKSSLTRAEFAAIISRILNLEAVQYDNRFSDVSNADWFAESVAAVYEKGLMTGISESEFAPGEPVTREQAATIFARSFGIEGSENNDFYDNSEISHWAKSAVGGICAKNIMQGYDGKFMPKQSLTREMCAVIAMRILEDAQ